MSGMSKDVFARMLDRLRFLVEYLEFHTAEAGNWSQLLPEYQEVIDDTQAVIQEAEIEQSLNG